jgi:hypothetical protein
VGRRDGNQKNRATVQSRTLFSVAGYRVYSSKQHLSPFSSNAGTSFLSAMKIANEDFLVP